MSVNEFDNGYWYVVDLKKFARRIGITDFLSDFLANETGATREQGIAAWQKLKTLDVPKDYKSWLAARRSRKAK